jgi:exopolysaccharide biosynthesis WecB/TagA/CpsF family protein
MKLSTQAVGSKPAGQDTRRVVHHIDNYDLPTFLNVAENFGTEQYGYVVTPNVDHMIRYHENGDFRALYAQAAYVLLDSRVAALAFRMVHGVRIPVCTGSDLTEALLSRVAGTADRIVIIGGSERQARLLKSRYGLQDLHHYNPPMGFINDARAVEACLQFIEAASPFRFCLIAVGSPRQEILAQLLAERTRARGLALCIGASIDFLTGGERRAPFWMQRVGLEWLYRLMQNPRRLAWRYLVRGPKFFAYVGSSQIEVRDTRPRGS